MSSEEEKPAVGRNWRDVNSCETEDDDESPTTQEMHSDSEDMENTVDPLSQRGNF